MCCPAAVGKAFGQSGLAVSGLKLTGGEDCQPETKSVFFRFGFPLFETPPPPLPPLLVPQAASSPGPIEAAAPTSAASRRNSRRVWPLLNVDIAPLLRSRLSVAWPSRARHASPLHQSLPSIRAPHDSRT